MEVRLFVSPYAKTVTLSPLKEEREVFLGTWCGLNSQADWNNGKETVPYPWADRVKLNRDQLSCRQYLEDCIAPLTHTLNQIHEKNYSTSFWKILLMPWLSVFAECVLERVLVLESAVEYLRLDKVNVYAQRNDEWYVQENTVEFVERLTRDHSFNGSLFCYLLENIVEHHFCFQYLSEVPLVKTTSRTLKASFSRRLKSFVSLIVNKIPRDILACDLYVSPRHESKINSLLSGKPFFLPATFVSQNNQWNAAQRLKLEDCLPLGKETWKKAIRLLLPKLLPKVFVEDFGLLLKHATNVYPQVRHLFVTSIGQYSNETLKAAAALNAEKHGCKFVIVQHGGHYGTGRFSTFEWVEGMQSDVWMPWGLRPTPYAKTTVSAPPYKINGNKCYQGLSQHEKICVVLSEVPPYSYWIYSACTHAQMSDYFRQVQTFFSDLKSTTRSQCLVRTNPQDLGWGLRKNLSSQFESLEFSNHQREMIDEALSSRLFVTTYNATTFLETFIAGVPTLFFFNPAYWELNEVAQPYFENLHQQEVFLHSGKEAAQVVEKIKHDPFSWWQEPQRQAAIQDFLRFFAQKSYKADFEFAQAVKSIR